VRRVWLLFVFFFWLLLPLDAHAYPLLAPRPVPNAIAGPTDPHLAAVFYNPAALGALRGLQLYIEAGPRFHQGEIKRDPVEGVPRGSADISFADFDAFVGLSWDFRTDRLTVAFATYTPFVELSSFPEQSAVRYHEISQRFAIVEQSFAAAFKVSDRFSFGAAANLAEGMLDYRYARDAAPAGGNSGINDAGGLCGSGPCGLENAAAAERLRLNGTGFGVGFSIGILGRPVDRLWMGLSYTSHVFDTGSQPLSDGRGTRVRPVASQTCVDPKADEPSTCNGALVVRYNIPDIIHAGIRVEATPWLDMDATLRWVHYGGMSQLDVRAQGGTLDQLAARRDTALPPQFLLDRGLTDAWAVGLGARFRVNERLRVSPTLVFETSAVETSAVSAAALDGPKFDLALTAEWRPVPHLILGAHFGGTGYLLGQVQSRYSSRKEADCVDSGYNLLACGPTNNGYALPSASGDYTLFVIHFGAAIGMSY
jgi:long-subunit fatty acid transport protein